MCGFDEPRQINFVDAMYRMQSVFFKLPESPSSNSSEASGISTPSVVDLGPEYDSAVPCFKDMVVDLVLEEVEDVIEEKLDDFVEEIKQTVKETIEDVKQRIMNLACDKTIPLFHLSEQLQIFRKFEESGEQKGELLNMIKQQKKIQSDRLSLVSNMIKNCL